MPDEAPQLVSDFGLTPKVEDAILTALKEQNTPKITSLIMPMHPSDQAQILNRTSNSQCEELLRLVGGKLDPEAITFLDEEVRQQAFDVLGSEIYARLLPSLDSDDMAHIAAELKPDDLEHVLEAMPLENRVEVKQALSYPDETAGRMMQREKIAFRLSGMFVKRLIMCARSLLIKRISIALLLQIPITIQLVRLGLIS